METLDSLSEEPWDVVIYGTGLQQSLLALALSRSKKRILHVDPNTYYGQHEAAFSLQEADSWAVAHADSGDGAGVEDTSATAIRASRGTYGSVRTWKHAEAEASGLSPSRAYAIALAPQIMHTRSKVLSQLVSSHAYRQVEFLAVGSFFVYQTGESGPSSGSLTRIPSSREDIFSASNIPTRSKRALMKFLKFVIDYESEERSVIWQDYADSLLVGFLAGEFKLEDSLRQYVLALTLTLDGKITVREGLATIHRHLTSTGVFGPGFCAVCPKWGGLAEVAQVACRAGAVGGGIYMLGTPMIVGSATTDNGNLPIELSNGVTVEARGLVTSREDSTGDGQDVHEGHEGRKINRLVAIVNAPLKHLFEVVVEGAPTPAVAIVAFPSLASMANEGEEIAHTAPIYAMVHSSDTGECPARQCVIYLTTLHTPTSHQALETALTTLLSLPPPSPESATTNNTTSPTALYKLTYTQQISDGAQFSRANGSASIFAFPPLSPALALADDHLDAVKAAWQLVMGDEAAEEGYMVFEDREGADAEDEGVYEDGI